MRPILLSGLLALALALAALPCPSPAADLDPVVSEGVIEAPVAEAWKAFTTKEGLESWMAAHADIDLKVGGRMRTHYQPDGTLGDDGTIENAILCYDPGRMIAIQVAKFPKGFPFPNAVKSMWTVVYFDPAGPGKTRVRCIGHGFTDDEESRKMRSFFQYGNDVTIQRFQKRFAPDEPKEGAKPEKSGQGR